MMVVGVCGSSSAVFKGFCKYVGGAMRYMLAEILEKGSEFGFFLSCC